jgi:hypothetical protein
MANIRAWLRTGMMIVKLHRHEITKFSMAEYDASEFSGYAILPLSSNFLLGSRVI